jgi:CRP-like cAMP-binding protein
LSANLQQPVPISDAVHARRVLATIKHFSDLPTEVLDALTRQMIPRHYRAGQLICLEGEPGETVFILEKGWVKVVRTAVDGREQATMFLHGSELFGDEAVFGGTTYPATVIALENVTTWALEGQALMALSQRYPALALTFLRHLGELVVYYVQLAEDLGLRNVQARVAHTLLNHAELRDGQLVVPRQAWTTLDEMAIRLGTVRDVLSRAISALEAEGILQMERTQIIISDPYKLLVRGRV